MSTDTRQITDAAAIVEEVAFGAARTAREVASDPIGSARKQVKGLERKGAPTARKVNQKVSAQLNAATSPAKDAIKGINAQLKKGAKMAARLQPERITVRYLQLVKVQARRQDAVGDVAKRALKAFNVSFKTIARMATRLEHASELSARPAVSPKRTVRTRRSSRRTAARRAA